jgi:hypothetical protein
MRQFRQFILFLPICSSFSLMSAGAQETKPAKEVKPSREEKRSGSEGNRPDRRHGYIKENSVSRRKCRT